MEISWVISNKTTNDIICEPANVLDLVMLFHVFSEEDQFGELEGALLAGVHANTLVFHPVFLHVPVELAL